MHSCASATSVSNALSDEFEHKAFCFLTRRKAHARQGKHLPHRSGHFLVLVCLSQHGYCFRRPLALVSRGGPAPCSTCAQITCEQSAFRVQPVNVSMQSADSTEHTCINADCTQCALLSARTCVCLHAGLENRENPEHLMQALADIETVFIPGALFDA